MTFKIKTEQTFTWPVKAKVPEDGRYKSVSFEATFNILSNDRMNDLVRGDDDPVGGSLRILREALVSFSGIDVEDDRGELITDDEDRNAAILRYPFFVEALSDAFLRGIGGDRTKN